MKSMECFSEMSCILADGEKLFQGPESERTFLVEEATAWKVWRESTW